MTSRKPELQRHPKWYPLVEKLTGMSVQQVSPSVVDGAIEMVMHLNDWHDEDQFGTFLESSPQGLRELVHHATVNETFFFREEAAIRTAVSNVIAPIVRSGNACTILSAGCSTGAEVYSLAMAIDSSLGSAALGRCSFLGLDIDDVVVQIAREGIYSPRLLRGLPADLQRRYLIPQGTDHFQIVPELAAKVEFTTANLVAQDAFTALPRCSVVFYRNLSIYFSAPVRRRVFCNLASLLESGGALFTASSETIAHEGMGLPMVESRGVFYFQKPAHTAGTGSHAIDTPPRLDGSGSHVKTHKPGWSAGTVAPGPSGDRAVPFGMDAVALLKLKSSAKVPPSPSSTDTSSPEHTGQNSRQPVPPSDWRARIRALAVGQRFQEARDLLKSVRATIPAEAPAKDRIDLALLDSALLYEENRLDESFRLCELVVAEDPLVVDARILLAMIARAKGQSDEALDQFKAALYIQSGHWAALFYSAQLEEHAGRLPRARSLYRRAREAVSNLNAAPSVLWMCDLDSVGAGAVQRLCDQALDRTRDAGRGEAW